jgi:nucleoid DNA-binding protein
MTKTDLVAKIAKEAGITQKAADTVLKVIVESIHQSLQGPDKHIRIPDLGTFKISHRKARTGVNPRTGQKIEIPAAQVPGFTAAKALKEAAKGE